MTGTSYKSLLNFIHSCWKIFLTDFIWLFDINNGIWFLIIPAFWYAISSILFPNNLWWSKLILVIIHKIGLIKKLVESYLPPIPVS